MDIQQIKYDKSVDAAYILYSQKKVYRTVELSPNIIIDFDEDNELRGIEILDFSEVIGESDMRRMTPRREIKIPLVLLKEFAERCYVQT